MPKSPAGVRCVPFGLYGSRRGSARPRLGLCAGDAGRDGWKGYSL